MFIEHVKNTCTTKYKFYYLLYFYRTHVISKSLTFMKIIFYRFNLLSFLVFLMVIYIFNLSYNFISILGFGERSARSVYGDTPQDVGLLLRPPKL